MSDESTILNLHVVTLGEPIKASVDTFTLIAFATDKKGCIIMPCGARVKMTGQEQRCPKKSCSHAKQCYVERYERMHVHD